MNIKKIYYDNASDVNYNTHFKFNCNTDRDFGSVDYSDTQTTIDRIL